MLVATQSALAKPPAKDKADDGFVGPYIAIDFGDAADFEASCDETDTADPLRPAYVKVPEELKPLVPSGTKPVEWRKGDLNSDGRPDYILVVEKDCMDRTLLVIVRRAVG